MTWLDVMLVALLVLSLVAGYRRGAVLQVMALLGLVGGVVAGVLLAPTWPRLGGTTHERAWCLAWAR